jgi:hypothetical protein
MTQTRRIAQKYEDHDPKSGWKNLLAGAEPRISQLVTILSKRRNRLLVWTESALVLFEGVLCFTQ